MVAVLMVTYNHETYIEEAIEGVMSQQTDYPIKLIIGDDASTDNTSAIIARLAEKYKGRILHILNSENLGMLRNFANIYSKANAPYIALCDGDDYWCDAHKLQMQLDFLEANPDFAICFHEVYEKRDEVILSNLVKSENENTFSIQELSKKNLINTCSVVLRKSALPPGFPDNDFLNLPAGDYPIYMHAAKNGKLKYLPNAMAVYRRHGEGAWSGLNAVAKTEKWLIVLEYLIRNSFDLQVREGILSQLDSCRDSFLADRKSVV